MSLLVPVHDPLPRHLDALYRSVRAQQHGRWELVFVDDEDKIRIRSVDIVRSDARFIYVAEGAQPGERVVLTALASPINGMGVRTQEGGG